MDWRHPKFGAPTRREVVEPERDRASLRNSRRVKHVRLVEYKRTYVK
jgi:hypothetical protein